MDTVAAMTAYGRQRQLAALALIECVITAVIFSPRPPWFRGVPAWSSRAVGRVDMLTAGQDVEPVAHPSPRAACAERGSISAALQRS